MKNTILSPCKVLEDGSYWFRYEDSHTDIVEPVLRCFEVISTTPKGVWLNVYGSKRWTCSSALKGFARPTKYAALVSFYKRKQRQVKILRAQLKRAESLTNQAWVMLHGVYR